MHIEALLQTLRGDHCDACAATSRSSPKALRLGIFPLKLVEGESCIQAASLRSTVSTTYN
jgi:hypothetical protein